MLIYLLAVAVMFLSIHVLALRIKVRGLQERMAVVESNIILLRPETFSKG